jgi:hypothetical protein
MLGLQIYSSTSNPMSYASVSPVSLHLGFRPILIRPFSCRPIWVASLSFLDIHLTFSHHDVILPV